jgi:hypothetical protein
MINYARFKHKPEDALNAPIKIHQAFQYLESKAGRWETLNGHDLEMDVLE